MSYNEEFLDHFRSALRASSGTTMADELTRASILNGIVRDDHDLFDIYIKEVGPQQAVLDIHLEGEGVSNHSTNAESFAKFVLGLSDAVKETAKAEVGAQRAASELLIEGALPGSVRVVLKAPPVEELNNFIEETPSSLQSRALRKISQVLSIASDEDELVSETLDASVQSLPVKARKRLSAAVGQALSSSWSLKGALEQRKYGVEDLTIDSRSAAKLKVALERGHEEPSIEKFVGTIDGVRRSGGIMWFKPDDKPVFAATVKDDALLQRVAELNALEDQQVSAIFDVLTVFDQGDSAAFKKSRTLISINTSGDAPELPMEIVS